MKRPTKIAFYLRVSRSSQDYPSQLHALREFCRRHGWPLPAKKMMFAEKQSGRKESRTELEELRKAGQNGHVDLILVYDQTRIGRSAIHQLNLFREWHRLAIRVVGVADGLDTGNQSATDKRNNGMNAVQAEFESDKISERTKAGLKAARAAGRFAGRPRKNDAKIATARRLRAQKKYGLREIARRVGLNPGYLSRELAGK